MHVRDFCLCPDCIAREAAHDELQRAANDAHAGALLGAMRRRDKTRGLVPQQVSHGVVRFGRARAV